MFDKKGKKRYYSGQTLKAPPGKTSGHDQQLRMEEKKPGEQVPRWRIFQGLGHLKNVCGAGKE